MKRYSARMLLPTLLGAAILLGACAAPPEPAAQNTEAPDTLPTTAPTAATVNRPANGGVRLADGTVIASARVLPINVLNLSFESAGLITEVHVQPGATVTAGQPLASLDVRQLELMVEEAQTQLAEARANYERLNEGAAPAQVARAQAQLDAARARLNSGRNSVTQEDVAAAQAELREARAVLAKLKAGPKAEDIAILQAEIDNARARLQTRRDSLSVEKNQAESRVARTSLDLENKQDEYSRIYWENQGIISGGELPQDKRDNEAQALRAVEEAERLRDEAQLALEESQKNEISEINAYEADVTQAEARLNKALLDPDPDQIASAEKRVLQAEAGLARLNGAKREFDVSALQAQVREAEASLAALSSDPLTSDLAIAEARVARAELQLKQAQLDVERGVLRAPFAGNVAVVEVEPGQLAENGTTAFVLADLSKWHIITDNLTELNIGQIRQGDKVVITFFALPDLELTGKVSYIETVGRAGDVGTNYSVTIDPDAWDERLRWNMSAQVFFVPGS